MEQNVTYKVPVVNEQPQVVTSPPPGPYYSQQVVVTQAQPTIVNTSGYIAYACCVFWCCNWPMGLIAFIFAMMASAEANSGNVDKAQSYGKASLWISTAGIIMTVILIVVLVAIQVTSGTSTTYRY